jgi:carbon storage regulator
MLVLSRKQNEQIRIEGPCVITLVEIRGDNVRIGFEAERGVRIVRTELDDRKDSK